MNAENLSPRLEKVAHYVEQYVPKPIKLADIGSDHAYLPCYMALRDDSLRAIAGEVVEGPYQSAKQEVIKQGLQDRIFVRKGDGLSVVTAEDNVNAVTICGMGGALIQTILEEGKDKLASNTTLVLQPNIGEMKVREWLNSHQYRIVEECIIEDHGRLYPIIVAQWADSEVTLTQEQLFLGAYHMEHPTPLFYKKIAQEFAHLEGIYEKVSQSVQNNDCKKEQLKQQMAWIRQQLGSKGE